MSAKSWEFQDSPKSRKKSLLHVHGKWRKSKRGSSPSHTVITLSKTKLEKKYSYNDLKDTEGLKESFIVGRSTKGTITQKINTLPHLLIAGTTGGGKSQFFKQALLGLLQSSPALQMYLIDLKGGIEMRPFGKLSNVENLHFH